MKASSEKTKTIKTASNHGAANAQMNTCVKDGIPPLQCKNEERMNKVFSNPELARFTPRQLIDELKARGYSGQLKYTHTINL